MMSETLTCEVAGCHRQRHARGLCPMHYWRLRTQGEIGPAGSLRAPRGGGHVTNEGYRLLFLPAHPLASAHGQVGAHRVTLFEKLGPAEHPCHWCGSVLPWLGGSGAAINVDHLDGDRLNNHPDNLVPSCLACNTKRGRHAE